MRTGGVDATTRPEAFPIKANDIPEFRIARRQPPCYASKFSHPGPLSRRKPSFIPILSSEKDGAVRRSFDAFPFPVSPEL